MPKIHKLSREEAQKIAAGEVVERPASVVKELVENSIDAGATAITVTIEDGGKKLIACRDNGCGMDPADARLCIETHATSKIQKLDDLFNLNTFGFRGEALASLTAVGDLMITTKDAHHAEGLRLTVVDGAVAHQEVVAHQTGTLIEVRNLFSTVPARLKFLKKSDTEQRHSAHLFDALFLPHPAIHAKLVIDDSIHKNYPATKTVHERAEQILMHKAQASLIPCQYTKNGITIEGAISNHQTYRFDKSLIYLFVNRRWVKNISLTRAVMRAYTVLPEGKFPIVSLQITIDPAIIDVNIHPRKEEVAFTQSAPVEQAITNAIKEALEKELLPQSGYMQAPKVVDPFKLFASYGEQTHWKPGLFPQQLSQSFFFDKKAAPEFNTQIGYSIKADIPTQHAASPIAATQNLQPINMLTSASAESSESFFTVLGQIDATYMLASTKDGLTIVDQHAAHERILYEQFVARFGTIDTVQLLFPEIIQFSQADYALVIEYQELLAQHGVLAEPFGADQIRITALPVFAKHISARDAIASLITAFHEVPHKADAHQFVTNALRAQMACKAAVKAGDILSNAQMEQLLRDLAKTPNKLTCPHGRPTYWVITLAELEKKFQRRT